MSNIFPIDHMTLQRSNRAQLLNQKSLVIWLTGLSGSGKSTIAIALEKILFDRGYASYLLDGDNIRNGINAGLTFSNEDREENIRRIAEVSKLMLDAGLICINSFVSPTIAIRAKAKNIIGTDDFVEVFINTPLEVCEQRDVKGLYKKARAGEIKNFTGIDAPYEAPENPTLEIHTVDKTPEECAMEILEKIISRI